MTTMSRACAKTFMKSLSAFRVVKDMVSRAVDPTKPSLVKSLAKNRVKLDEAFVDLCYCFENYCDGQMTHGEERNRFIWHLVTGTET